jgi:hypothetical protein
MRPARGATTSSLEWSTTISNKEENAKARRKRWVKNHIEHARTFWREGAKRWRRANRVRTLLIAAKARANKLQMPFELSVDDISIPSVCPVLKIPLEFQEGKKTSNSPSLDRVDNSKGYVKGNVRVISYRANRLKSDMTFEECKSLLEDFERCRVK